MSIPGPNDLPTAYPAWPVRVYSGHGAPGPLRSSEIGDLYVNLDSRVVYTLAAAADSHSLYYSVGDVFSFDATDHVTGGTPPYLIMPIFENGTGDIPGITHDEPYGLLFTGTLTTAGTYGIDIRVRDFGSNPNGSQDRFSRIAIIVSEPGETVLGWNPVGTLSP